jgi:cephalosporin-C deacetylase-like acetyl esterase
MLLREHIEVVWLQRIAKRLEDVTLGRVSCKTSEPRTMVDWWINCIARASSSIMLRAMDLRAADVEAQYLQPSNVTHNIIRAHNVHGRHAIPTSHSGKLSFVQAELSSG